MLVLLTARSAGLLSRTEGGGEHWCYLVGFSGWNRRFDRWEIGGMLVPWDDRGSGGGGRNSRRGAYDADSGHDDEEEEDQAEGTSEAVGPGLPPEDDDLCQVKGVSAAISFFIFMIFFGIFSPFPNQYGYIPSEFL